MASFLADEDFDHRIAARLRVLGHDVMTLAVLGLAGSRIPDEAVLSAATAEGRALLTHNRLHFVRLHRQTRAHAGIFISSQTRDPAAQANRIHAVVNSITSLAGRLVRINADGHAVE